MIAVIKLIILSETMHTAEHMPTVYCTVYKYHIYCIKILKFIRKPVSYIAGDYSTCIEFGSDFPKTDVYQ
jgi:hypothetical protein